MTITEGRWDLSPLYAGKDDPALQEDFKKLEEAINEADQIFTTKKTSLDQVEQALQFVEKFRVQVRKLSAFYSLTVNANTKENWATAQLNKLQSLLACLDPWDVEFKNRLAKLDLEEVKADGRFDDYLFAIGELIEQADHSLDGPSEELISQLDIYGVGSWENLFDVLTSSATADLNGDEKSLTELRNLAYDPDQEVRHQAYEAELSLYPQIELPLAYALTSIKGQVNFLANKRGFTDPIDETLFKSRMSRETLDALISAMKEKKDVFVDYFKAKGKYYGQDQLHWADLFAPMGKLPSSCSVEESKEILVDSFAELHQPISDLIQKAYDDNWIDFFPRDGKVGGAFCSNLPFLGQSRVLTNFDGSFSAVDTLAHELGHAYHGARIQDHKALNQRYTMPVAETASTFNETHFLLEALEKAEDPEVKIGLLDSFLMNTSQVINDILSRFLFEDEVFNRVKEEMLTPEDLKDIMHRAQLEAYGDGIEEDTLHPYMWACKGHYYSASLSYYNFPYAFGALFAMALYKKAQEEGPTFMEKYDEMLTATTVAKVEEVGQLVGLDFTDKATWLSSLEAFEDYVQAFVYLVDQVKS